MNLLDLFILRKPDPTLNWEALGRTIPDFDLATGQFGRLRFGDPIEAAAFLGRPDQFKWSRRDYGELLYAAGGFEIDFDKDRFAYLAFFIGPDAYLPKHAALQFSEPRLRGGSPDGLRLTRQTDRTMVEKLLGTADVVDVDSDETILFYTRHGVTMEFELDGQLQRLKRWNLFPK